MTRSLPATSSSPWVAVMVKGATFLVRRGTPGLTEHTRKSKDGTPSSVRSRPKTSTATPNSKTATGSIRTTLTRDSDMRLAYWQEPCVQQSPAKSLMNQRLDRVDAYASSAA